MILHDEAMSQLSKDASNTMSSHDQEGCCHYCRLELKSMFAELRVPFTAAVVTITCCLKQTL